MIFFAFYTFSLLVLTADIVNKRVASVSEEGEQETRDVLDYMISKHKFTPEEIINELVALM